MFKRWMLIILCLLPLLSLAKIYRWTDEDGNVHFTDKPKQGATTVKLPKMQEYSAPEEKREQPPNSTAGSVDYEEVVISQPDDNATIRNNQGFVAIMVHTKPELGDGDKLQLKLNGRNVGEPQTSPSFALKNLERGSYNISVDIVNRNGDVVLSSSQKTIHMHRPRVGMGKVPIPGSSPPTKPTP